ncbi:MAG: hypothetical protein II784_05930 [Oscillospiraceae bacterium]|nr:hypothetical protein [Oscillospiraceae bacterium]
MKKAVVLFAIIAALALSLSACGKKTASEIKTPAGEPQVTEDVQTPAENGGQAESSENGGQAEPSETGETETTAERQDGERFEEVIILEGMEETVHYEHVRNDEIGFEMDYDYELFVRNSEKDREWFVSVWDDADNPENYIEVKYNPQDAESIAASVGSLLSNDYDISRDDAFMLARAGSCIRIDASADVGGLTMPDHLQMVYIIPADDGCRVATAHYAIEASEGFGRRFHYFMDTFSAIASQAEKRMSDEQAVAAIRNYCYINNPDLEKYVNSGEYPVYWDISSSGEKEIVVVFRSYTGSVNRYYIDPVSGETYVTELVPGIKDEERRTDESLNAWIYLF